MSESSKIKFELKNLNVHTDACVWRVLKEIQPGIVVSFGVITHIKETDPYHLVIPNLLNMVECSVTDQEWQEIDEFMGQIE